MGCPVISSDDNQEIEYYEKLFDKDGYELITEGFFSLTEQDQLKYNSLNKLMHIDFLLPCQLNEVTGCAFSKIEKNFLGKRSESYFRINHDHYLNHSVPMQLEVVNDISYLTIKNNNERLTKTESINIASNNSIGKLSQWQFIVLDLAKTINDEKPSLKKSHIAGLILKEMDLMLKRGEKSVLNRSGKLPALESVRRELRGFKLKNKGNPQNK